MLMKKPRLRKFVSCVLFWLGLLVIGILAIPAGILFGVNYLFGEALDFILEKIEKDQKKK